MPRAPPVDVPGQLFPALPNEAIPPPPKRFVFPAVCSPRSADFTSTMWGSARDVTSCTAGVASCRVSHVRTGSRPTAHPVPRRAFPKHASPASLAPRLPASRGFPVPAESRADPSAKKSQSPVRTAAGLCGRFPRTPSGHLSPCTPRLSQLHVSHFCQSCRALLASHLIRGAFTRPRRYWH